MAFLSLLDNRAKPKGSRDPLGFEMVWSHFGRNVVGNLTTITSQLPNFAVALLGFTWANDQYRHLPSVARHATVRDFFLRYEQLAGYLRYLAGDEKIMGITRVSRRIGDETTKITFGRGADEQILSDQVSYGLWGLYSSAMRDTGLVAGDTRDPTSLGRSIATQMETKLDTSALIDMMTSKRRFGRSDLKPYARSFLAAIADENVQKQLLHPLMSGSGRVAMQQELWRVTQSLAKRSTRIDSVPDFIKLVMSRTNVEELRRKLEDIEKIERILVAANNIFEYCRRKDGEPMSVIIKSLDDYEYSHLPGSIDLNCVPHGEALEAIREALKAGQTRAAVTAIFELNKSVMEHRGGAPWVEVEAGDTLRVRVQSEVSELRPPRDLLEAWDYDYFLGSFISIAGQGLGLRWMSP